MSLYCKMDKIDNASALNKCLKLLLILGLSSYLVKYVYTAFDKFDRGLVSTNTRVESMSSFDFPSISICQKIYANDTVEKDGFSIRFAIHGLRINQTYHTRVDITPTPEEGENVNPDTGIPNNKLWDQHSEVFWLNPFQCINYRPPAKAKTVFKGLGSVFAMRLHVTKEYESLFMFLSHPRLLRTRNLFGGSVYMLNSPKEQSTKHFIFSIKFRKKIRLHRDKLLEGIRRRQCSDDIYEELQGETMEQCMQTYINSKFPCYKHAIFNNMSCTKEELRYINVLQGIGETEFSDVTGCPFPCMTYSYDANLMNTFIKPRKNDAQKSSIVVYVYISEATMEISEEFLVYDEESLMGDVGGMVGMLMGVSILAVYETIFNFVINMMKKPVKK